MKGQPLSPEFAGLRQHWSWWTGVVEEFARRRRGASVVTPEEYQARHRQLLAACRALGGEAKSELGQRLEELVRPWLTVHALRHADREIILDLLVRCRQAELELPFRRPRGVSRWAVAALLGVLAVAGLVFFMPEHWASVQEWVQDHWRGLVRTVQTADGSQWWLVPGAFAAVALAVLVWGSGRNLTGR